MPVVFLDYQGDVMLHPPMEGIGKSGFQQPLSMLANALSLHIAHLKAGMNRGMEESAKLCKRPGSLRICDADLHVVYFLRLGDE